MRQEAEGRRRAPPAPRASTPGGAWTAATWIALSSMLVAACALATSFWQAYLGRQHQRLSVRPHVAFNFYYTDGSAKFSMDNRGVGPARLRWFSASVDGKPQASWPRLLEAIGATRTVAFQGGYPGPGVMMPVSPVDRSIEILSVNEPAGRKVLIDRHKRITLAACYCSLYGQCWVTSTDVQAPVRNDRCEPAPPVEFAWEPP